MAANEGHTEVPGGSHKFPPLQVDTYASQLLWLTLTFVALYVLMSRLALPRIGSIISDRKQHIEGDFAQADRLKKDADAALAAYEKSLADARGRAQGIANETRDKLNAEAEHTRKGLEEELNRKLVEAEKIIAGTTQSALANVRGIAIDTTAAIVERLVGVKPAINAVEAAVDAALKR